MNKAERWTRKKKNWKKKELERRERELQRKEGERNKENCLNSNEVIFCNLQRTVAGPSLSDEWMRTKGKLNGRLQKLHVEAKLILLKRKLRTRIKNLDFNVTKFTIYLMIIVFILCNFYFCEKICKHMLSWCHIHHPQSCALF